MIEAAKMILKSKVEALEEEAVEMKESNRMIVKEDAEGDKDYDNAKGEKGNLDAVVDVDAEITDVQLASYNYDYDICCDRKKSKSD